MKLDVVVKDVLTAEQKELITTPVKLTEQSLSTDESGAGTESEGKMSPINYIVVYLLIILLFTSTMMTGNMIASEITGEKRLTYYGNSDYECITAQSDVW